MSEVLELEVVRLGFRGEGIAVAAGTPNATETWRVANTAVGDVVRAEPLETTWGPARARLVEVVEAGPDRSPPACARALRCPGCQLHHLDGAARRRHIAAGWTHLLATNGLDAMPDPIWVRPSVDAAGTERGGYRTRARLAWADDGGGWKLGVWPARHALERSLISMDACPAHTPALDAAQRRLAAVLEPVSSPLRIALAVVGVDAAIDAPAGVRVVLAPRDDAASVGPEALVRGLAWPDGWHVGWHVGGHVGGHVGVQRAGDTTWIHGDGSLRVAVPEGAIRVPWGAWWTATPLGAAVVRARVLRAVDGLDPAPEAIVELGCGVGTHAPALAARCGARARYVGVDLERTSIAAALAAWPDLDFRLGRADRVLRRLARSHRGAGLVAHTMRRGILQNAERYLAALAPAAVIHVAPTAQALADDGPRLRALGLRPSEWTLIETMPWTYHAMAVTAWVRA